VILRDGASDDVMYGDGSSHEASIPGIAGLKLQPTSMVLQALQAYNESACKKVNRSKYHVTRLTKLIDVTTVLSHVDQAPDVTGTAALCNLGTGPLRPCWKMDMFSLRDIDGQLLDGLTLKS